MSWTPTDHLVNKLLGQLWEPGDLAKGPPCKGNLTQGFFCSCGRDAHIEVKSSDQIGRWTFPNLGAL